MNCLHVLRRFWLGLATLLAAGVATLSPLHAQTPPSFDRVEYFLDNDPGYGNGTAVALPANPGTTLTNLRFAVDLGGLAPGFHNLFIRSRAGTNRWSQTSKQLLYIGSTSATGPAPALNRVEYFVDADPGYGNATAVTLPASPSNSLTNLTFAVPLGGVAPGFHSLYFRSRDANGAWSQTQRQVFYVSPITPTTPPPALASLEYFVDTDPGHGKATSAPITGGTNATGVSFSVGLGSLSVGFHTLFYRVKDAAGQWSQTQNRIFYVDDRTVATVPNLNKAEYYVDTDPGYGSATDIPIATPAPNLPSLNLIADLSTLPDGPHRLFVRVRDANGRWSQVLNRSFTKSGCSSAENLASGRPSASYTGSGISPAASEAIFNGGPLPTSSAAFLNGYYAQADLGSLRTVSEVRLNLQNPNNAAVSYTLQVETSSNLTTWALVDSYQSVLAASQTTPVLVTRTLAAVQTNVRGIRLRLLLPTLSQGIQLTNAGVFYFNCVGPTITSFTPTGGPAGTEVTITGTNLGGATAVTFNGVPAGTITNNTATSLTVAAPAGGSSGQICVTTPGGTACSTQSYQYPPTIATGTVSPATFCAGQTISVPFSTNTAGYGTGNEFKFQLSDASGNFAPDAPLLGTAVNVTANGGTVNGAVPLATPAGTGYRVRVVASNPATTGSTNSVNLTINTTPVSQAAGPATVANGSPINLTVTPTYPGATYQWSGPNGFSSTQQNPTIASATNPGVNRFTVTVTLGSCTYSSSVDVNVQPSTAPLLTLTQFAGPLCVATPRNLAFNVTGSPFPAGNVITAQLSDASGSFVTPTAIGSTNFTGLGNGSVSVALPRTTPVGSGYRIRLVGSNPATIVSNDNGSDLTVNALPEVTVSSNSPVTAGGTLQLQGGPAATGTTYSWTFTPASGGSTSFFSSQQNPQITNAQPTQSGRYRLALTNANGCTDTASTRVIITPVTTLTLSAASGPLCVGTSYTLSFTAGGPAFNTGNVVSAVLSSPTGVFSADTLVIGSTSFTTTGAGTLSVTIPATSPASNSYRIRLRSSNPVVVSNIVGVVVINLTTASAGSNSPVTVGSPISLTATGISGATYQWTGPNNYTATGPNQTISSATAANAGTYQVTISLNGCTYTSSTTVVVNPALPVASIQTLPLPTPSFCAGTALRVAFTATGFAAGNVFTAQLSDANGVFGGSPVTIATLTGTTSDTIAAVIPANTPAGTGYRIRVVGSQPPTLGTDNGTNLTIGPGNVYTWLGTVSNSWNEPGNWSCGYVPTVLTNVLIPAGRSRYPVAGEGSTARDLTIANGASLTLGARFLLAGNLVNDGTLTVGTNALECNGTAPQTLGGSSTTRLYDLVVNNAAGATLASPLSVRHLLTLTAGNLASGGNLTLLSDATSTAMVVNPAGGGAVTGRATMERFNTGLNVAGYRSYASPMRTGTATVQEFADDVPGFNVNPDYNTQGPTVTPFPTLFQYDQTRLTATADTFRRGFMVPLVTDNLTSGRGYLVQVPPATTVDISGTLNNSDVSYSLTRGPYASSGWHLLGNPFPSPLDWDLVPTAPGVDRALYVYTPSGPYTGTYRSYVSGIGQNGGAKDIATMQGFFVRANTTTATLSLPNAARATSYLNPVFDQTTSTQAATNRPLVRLNVRSATGQTDEAVVYFEAQASQGFDPAYDAYKIQLNGAGYPSLWSIVDNEALAINAQPGDLGNAYSIPLGVHVSQPGAHTLNAMELLNLPASTTVWLEDRFLNVRQNLGLNPAYTFTVAPDCNVSLPGTGGCQRFYLSVEPVVTATTAQAALQASTSVFPNPTTSTATLQVSHLRDSQPVTVEVLTTLGQVVSQQSVRPRQGSLSTTIDLHELAVGIYLVRVRTAEGTVVKRLMRQ